MEGQNPNAPTQVRVLTIIDMQENFQAAKHKPLQLRIAAEIDVHPGPICVVEYDDELWRGKYGPTVVEVAAVVARARERGRQIIEVKKYRDDGGKEIIKACKKAGVPKGSRYVLMGVNTTWCVLETAEGILRNDKKASVTILRNGVRCWDDDKTDYSAGVLRGWSAPDANAPVGRQRRFVSPLVY